MKKILISLLILITLCGCNTTKNLDEEKYEYYLTIYQSILNHDNKNSCSQNYNIELVVNKLADDNYRYDVIIDEPKVAMYNIKAMAVIDDITSHIDDNVMMPSLAILDDGIYHLIPYQVDKENHFYEGVILSLTSNEPSISLGVYVEFSDSTNNKTTKEYLKLTTNYQENEEAQ